MLGTCTPLVLPLVLGEHVEALVLEGQRKSPPLPMPPGLIDAVSTSANALHCAIVSGTLHVPELRMP